MLENCIKKYKVLQSTREIEVGDELFVSYGKGYWKNALVLDTDAGFVNIDEDSSEEEDNN